MTDRYLVRKGMARVHDPLSREWCDRRDDLVAARVLEFRTELRKNFLASKLIGDGLDQVVGEILELAYHSGYSNALEDREAQVEYAQKED